MDFFNLVLYGYNLSIIVNFERYEKYVIIIRFSIYVFNFWKKVIIEDLNISICICMLFLIGMSNIKYCISII